MWELAIVSVRPGVRGEHQALPGSQAMSMTQSEVVLFGQANVRMARSELEVGEIREGWQEEAHMFLLASRFAFSVANTV